MKEEIFLISSKFQKWFIVIFSREWHICEVILACSFKAQYFHEVKSKSDSWYLNFLSPQQELIKIGNFLLNYTSNILINTLIYLSSVFKILRKENKIFQDLRIWSRRFCIRIPWNIWRSEGWMYYLSENLYQNKG